VGSLATVLKPNFLWINPHFRWFQGELPLRVTDGQVKLVTPDKLHKAFKKKYAVLKGDLERNNRSWNDYGNTSQFDGVQWLGRLKPTIARFWVFLLENRPMNPIVLIGWDGSGWWLVLSFPNKIRSMARVARGFALAARIDFTSFHRIPGYRLMSLTMF